MSETKIKLSQLSRAGGAAGKLAPELLRKVLSGVTPGIVPPQLLAGRENADDAVVYQLNAQQAIVATTDFFTPIVDDPCDFGRIAATNAISSVYAMGGTPLFALALAGMPADVLPAACITGIFEGGAQVCRDAGIPIAGGHSIDAPEPIYGLVVIGLVNPAHLKRNSVARPGDKLILGKPLGVGIYVEAQRQGLLTDSDYEALIECTTQLNTPGPVLACLDGVHALTDIGGCGLLGHLLDVCKGSGLRARVDFSALPLLPKTLEFARLGQVAEVARRNWAGCRESVALAAPLAELECSLLADPQTSGGLLVSCTPETVTEVLSVFLQQGFVHVSVIGELGEGLPGVDVV
ncbi:MAG: selD [Proteobacteria bacterium]|nr:selD [Pseudomonadota bacterium]